MYTVYRLEWCLTRRLIQHDRYLEALCEQLQLRYDALLRNVPLYSRKKRRIKRILATPSVRNTFFFCGESQRLFTV